MFQFSNLLNRTDAERQRRRASLGHKPHSLDGTAGSEHEVNDGTRDDSLPERVRRELDEQMERLTKLLDHVESLETLETDESYLGSEEDADASEPICVPQIFRGEESEPYPVPEQDTGSDSDGDSLQLEFPAVPEDILLIEYGPGPDLDAAVFGVESEVVSDLVFASSSADGPATATQCESISVHTEEIVPFPSLKTLDCGEQPSVIAKPSLGTAAKTNQPSPVIRLNYRRSHRREAAAKTVQRPLQASTKSADTLVIRRGVVQDFSCGQPHIANEQPTLEIFEPEFEASTIELANTDNCDCLDELIVPTVPRADALALKLPFHDEPAIQTPEFHERQRGDTDNSDAGRRCSPICEPDPITHVDIATQFGPEHRAVTQSVAPWEMLWSPVVIEAAIADPIGPQMISVAPPRSDVVLLKQDGARTLDTQIGMAPGTEAILQEAVQGTPPAPLCTPQSLSVEIESPLGVSKYAQPPVHRPEIATRADHVICDNELDLRIQNGHVPANIGSNSDKVRNSSLESSEATIKVQPMLPHAGWSQFLNVLAVLGGLLALATLAFVATDLASWL